MERLGRYEIVKELGRGAMGTVYRARDPKIDRVVAVKTIAVAGGSPAEEEEYRQRFFREAQAAGKLSHPGLVTIYDVGEEETSQTPFIVMEFIEGTTLEQVAGGGVERIPLDQALDLVRQVAEALDYAHAHGIIHRDIKPANIIVTEEGRAKITDFGIAKVARGMSQMTQAGQILGTPAYMAPEQLSGGAVDGRSDLFSLGVVLYWLLTGDKPFTGDTATTVSFKVVYKDVIPVTELNPALPAALNHVISRALAKDPAERYQRGKELADDLEELRRGRRPRSLGEGTQAASERTIVARARGAAPSAKIEPLLAAGKTALGVARRIPPRAYAGLAGALLVLWGAWAVIGALQPRSNLNVQVRHNFRSAELTIWADGSEVFDTELKGAVKERFGGLLTSVEGSLAEIVEVPVGQRTLRVQVSAPDEGYEQTKEVKAEFVEEGEKTLYIGFGEETRNLYLNLRD